MKFIENIGGDFILKPTFDYLNKTEHSLRLKKFNSGEIILKVSDIDMGGAEFKVVSIENVDKMVDKIQITLITKLQKKVAKVKKIVKKVINEWENNPKNFKLKEVNYSDDKIYVNESCLSDNEYHTSVYAIFNKYHVFYEKLDFVTGNGFNTYYNKQYFIDGLEDIDEWLEKEIEKIKTSKIKKRFKTYVLKNKFYLSFKDIIKYVDVSTSNSKKEMIKPKFPMVFKASELNDLLYFIDEEIFIDNNFINDIKDDFEMTFDLSILNDWLIRTHTDEEHDNDGQMCDYVVTFISPEGYEYYLYERHSLITGWNFYGEEFKPQ